MGLKKSYFKGLQNGVNSSPIRQNGIGVDKKLPILQPLTLEQLLGEKIMKHETLYLGIGRFQFNHL